MLNLLLKILPARDVYAHCDVPCGIYDPKPAQIAAATVKRMVEGITKTSKSTEMNAADYNQLVRLITTKEEHAQKCKQELLILWTDYFKHEHLDKFPDLHETFWKAAKLCSRNKQNVDLPAAEELVKAVNEIADIFHQAEAAKAKA